MRTIALSLLSASLVAGAACKRTVYRLPAEEKEEKPPAPLLRPNVLTDFNPDVNKPQVNEEAFIDPLASVIGDVELGKRVYLAPFSSVRGDEGQPIHIGDESNVQDGVVLHALETIGHKGEPIDGRTYKVDGKDYAVYVGERVSMAHQSQVHGPAWVEDDVFVGMQALVFKAHVGKGSVIEPGAKVVGVEIPPGRYVRMGSVVNNQKDADALPLIDDAYPFRTLNAAVVHVNTSFADGYGGRDEVHADDTQHASASHAPLAEAHASDEKKH
jgi:carbonic anhydrase/acetyltransferase-like protein (isoleucine patch superfamily)